jgi:hypothetical protein
MQTERAEAWSRREFLTGLTVTAGLLAVRAAPVAAEPPPETTRIRLVHDPSICVTPQYLAEELLRADGFSEVQYIEATDGFGTRVVAAGGADMMMEFAGVYLIRIDTGDPIVLLGGVHIGCFEVFGAKLAKISFTPVRNEAGARRCAAIRDTMPLLCYKSPAWMPRVGGLCGCRPKTSRNCNSSLLTISSGATK